MKKINSNITRPKCALDLCLYVPGFQRKLFKQVETLSYRSNEMKEQKQNKRSALVADSAYNSQKAQFGLVMKEKRIIIFFYFEILCENPPPKRHIKCKVIDFNPFNKPIMAYKYL